MKKKIFILMIILQLGVFLAMVYEKSNIARKGTEYKFRITYYDPYDFMRGNYLRISLVQREVDKIGDTDPKKKKGYFVIENHKESAKIIAFSKKKPKNSDFIRGELSYSYDGKHIIKTPFERYYIEQKLAPEMEKKLRNSNEAYLVVKIYKGKYIIESIEI